MEDDEREKPFIDLHPSEWRHEKKPEPFFGVNGLEFVIYFVISFPIYWVVTTIYDWLAG